MKPLHSSNDSNLAHETSRKDIGERLKQAFHAAMGSLAAPSCGEGLCVPKKIERRRVGYRPEEGSIRTIMFLGSWSHT
ncbi:hypothetical protein SAY87_006644 [Trapa incisa]|uniref:Uncharacterized protein n=1 Tax=Trapa incisa TaxID=236973 RepID=A0AAN7K1C3_9MYRT|nr:hypothetical protein SAY87_006644 [Trapa incisa]